MVSRCGRARIKPLNDFRPRGHHVANRAAADAPFELGDHVGRKSGRKRRKRRSRTMPIISQCPVTESLPAEASAIRHSAWRRQHQTVSRSNRIRTAAGAATRQSRRPIEAKRAQSRERAEFRDVAQRVAALVTVRRGVGQFAAADAVEHDEDDAGKGRFRVRNSAPGSSRPRAAFRSSQSRA